MTNIYYEMNYYLINQDRNVYTSCDFFVLSTMLF